MFSLKHHIYSQICLHCDISEYRETSRKHTKHYELYMFKYVNP